MIVKRTVLISETEIRLELASNIKFGNESFDCLSDGEYVELVIDRKEAPRYTAGTVCTVELRVAVDPQQLELQFN